MILRAKAVEDRGTTSTESTIINVIISYSFPYTTKLVPPGNRACYINRDEKGIIKNIDCRRFNSGNDLLYYITLYNDATDIEGDTERRFNVEIKTIMKWITTMDGGYTNGRQNIQYTGSVLPTTVEECSIDDIAIRNILFLTFSSDITSDDNDNTGDIFSCVSTMNSENLFDSSDIWSIRVSHLIPVGKIAVTWSCDGCSISELNIV